MAPQVAEESRRRNEEDLKQRQALQAKFTAAINVRGEGNSSGCSSGSGNGSDCWVIVAVAGAGDILLCAGAKVTVHLFWGCHTTLLMSGPAWLHLK